MFFVRGLAENLVILKKRGVLTSQMMPLRMMFYVCFGTILSMDENNLVSTGGDVEKMAFS